MLQEKVNQIFHIHAYCLFSHFNNTGNVTYYFDKDLKYLFLHLDQTVNNEHLPPSQDQSTMIIMSL